MEISANQSSHGSPRKEHAMSFSSRSPVVRLLLVGVLGLGCLVAAQERPPICEQIAETYGLSSFPQVEQIRYTFNVDLGQIKLSRSWVWETKTDRVSYESKDKNGKTVKYVYLRSQISSQPAEAARNPRSLRTGTTTRRPVLCLSRLTTPGRRTASRSASFSRTWPSNSPAPTHGQTLSSSKVRD